MGAYLKPKQKLTARETLKILDSQWITKYEIMKIAFCCDTEAKRHMGNIRKHIEEKGMFLPNKKYVPTVEVISYFNINVSQLKKLAREN